MGKGSGACDRPAMTISATVAEPVPAPLSEAIRSLTKNQAEVFGYFSVAMNKRGRLKVYDRRRWGWHNDQLNIEDDSVFPSSVSIQKIRPSLKALVKLGLLETFDDGPTVSTQRKGWRLTKEGKDAVEYFAHE